MAEKNQRLTENRSMHDVIREFHGEAPEMGMCLGAECPHKDCRVCSAAGNGRGKVFHDNKGNPVQSEDTYDAYRASVKKGYYSSSVIEITDPVTGKKRYIYSRPGG